MGQILSQPITEKKSEEGKDERVTYGLSSMQGWRVTMEDSHSTVLDMKRLDEDNSSSTQDKVTFFGVFDGHGGDRVALYCGERLHEIISKQPCFKRGDYGQAMKDGFLSTDRAILSDERYRNEQSGCTATTAIIANNRIYVANAGDSRTVLGVKGIAKPLSFDHKPSNEGEKARICAAGGYVDSQRVNGNLALSRAIGDFEFKKAASLPPEEQAVTAYPEVMEHDITPDDEFLVLACDGIWDCMHSQDVIEFVRRGISARQSLVAICENLMNNCLAPRSDMSGIGCDNMTVMIVGLLNGKTEEEWYDLIAKRVEDGDGPVAPESSAEMTSVDVEGAGQQQPEPQHQQQGEVFTLEQLLGQSASFMRSSNGGYVIQADDAARLLSSVGFHPSSGELEEVEDDEGEVHVLEDGEDENARVVEHIEDDDDEEEPETSDGNVKSPIPADGTINGREEGEK